MSDLDLENELLGSDDELASEPDVEEHEEEQPAKSPAREEISQKSNSPEVNGNAKLTSSSRGVSHEADVSKTRYVFA